MKKRTNYHKFVATAATATLAASAFVPVVSADVTPGFSDVGGSYKVAVDYLYKNNIIQGISPTQFGTAEEIKRVDVGVMLAKALYTEEEINSAAASGFSDVPTRAAKYLNVLKEEKIVNGKTETSYGADDPITRGEVAMMLAKAYELTGSISNSEFTDVASRYAEAVAALYDNDITKGKGNKQFGTNDAITRGELAIFLHKLETLSDVEVPGMEVTEVNEITETSVTVTINKATEVDEEATVEVKNPQGEVIDVVPTVIDIGDTTVTFDFKEAVDSEALDGVWTVNGTAYSFTAIKQLAAIMEAAQVTPLNELNLVKALQEAGLTNIDADQAASYATALTAEGLEINTLADVQEIIVATNENMLTEAEKEQATQAVKNATSQTQLLEALQKFERVNEAWIVSYEATKNQADFEAIQVEIDRVNTAEIEKEITATTEQLDNVVTAKTIELVEKYIVADEEDADATPKADLLEALKVHMLVVNVNEANTKEKFASAIGELAEASEELDAEKVYESQLDTYRTAIQNETTVASKNTAAGLQVIINAVNSGVVTTTLASLDEVVETTTEADVLTLLQNEVLELEGIVADYAVAYKEAIIEAESVTKENIQGIVNAVNAAQDSEAKFVAVNTAKTIAEMRTALVVIETGGTSADYTNLLTPAKNEVAELVLQAKGALTDDEFEDAEAVFEAITQAIADRTDFIDKVNAAEDISTMITALEDETVFPEFKALSVANKTDKAEVVLTALKALEDTGFTTIHAIKVAANE